MKCEMVIVGSLETNCYLVYCEETLECAIVDPGAEADKIFSAVEHNNLKPALLLNTHGHVDHIGANKDVKEKYDIPLLIHSADSSMLSSVLQSGLAFFLGAKGSPPADEYLEDGGQVKFGNSALKVIHTPGHSPGSVSFLGDGFVLSGDSLFCQGVGRTDLPGGSWQELVRSIKEKILTLPPETIVLPGHGPHTVVSQEKDSNPFIT
jgi:glyoxylase-like metal-dependent hydrolase (beta-lactamase superfamily II)